MQPKPTRRRTPPGVPCIVFVERITNVQQEYGYLVAVYGPFPSEETAASWLPVLKAKHPTFADDTRYWLGIRPLHNPTD